MKKIFYIYTGLVFIIVNLFLCSCNIKNSNNGTAAKVNRDSTAIHLKLVKKTILPSYKVVKKLDELQMPCIASKQTYKYDNKGNLIEYTCYSVDSIIGKGVLKYDDKGNKIEEDYYNEDGSLNGKNTLKYDDKGNLIEQEHALSDGSVTDKITYNYNSKDEYIEKNTTLLNTAVKGNSLTYKYTYKYDNKDNMIEENQFFLGDDEEKNIYKRNEKGGVVEMDRYGSSKDFIAKAVYKYDVNGNLTEQNWYTEGGGEFLDTKDIYKNDGVGNCIECDEYDGYGKLKETSTYKYDSNGNMIEQIGGSYYDINPLQKYYQYLLPWIH